MSEKDYKIEEMKKHHEKEMRNYCERIRDHTDHHGDDSCPYLEQMLQMSNYHRGCYNTLIAVQKLN